MWADQKWTLLDLGVFVHMNFKTFLKQGSGKLDMHRSNLTPTDLIYMMKIKHT